MRYIFEDTFTPRTYDPQPLTKYEIPQHLNEVEGLNPSPKKKPVSNSIPKNKPSLVRGRNKPKLKPGAYSHTSSNQQEVEDKKEEEEQKEEEAKISEEKGEDISAWFQSRQQNHEQNKVEIPDLVEIGNKPREYNLSSLWESIASISQQIIRKEEQVYEKISQLNPENGLIFIQDQAANLHSVISRLDITDGNAAQVLNNAIAPLRKLSIDNLISSSLLEQDGSEELDDNSRLAQSAQNEIINTKLLDYGTSGFAMRENEVIKLKNELDAYANDLSDLCKKMILNYSAMQSNMESRIILLKEISEEHRRAATTGNLSEIKHRISDGFYNAKKDPGYWKAQGIEQAIQSYLTTHIKIKAFKRAQLLVRAAKRLNRYVEQN